jgi:tetratricopeptide (TPR) repeat protein
LQLKDYISAANAFNRVISLDPEYGDAWNNLAISHLYSNNYKSALGALEQASKFKYDSWKLWENYLTTAIHTDNQDWNKAITAITRLIQLKDSTHKAVDYSIGEQRSNAQLNTDNQLVDNKIILFLTQIVEQSNDSFLLNRFHFALLALIDKISDNATYLHCASRVELLLTHSSAALDYAERAMRAIQLQTNNKLENLANLNNLFYFTNALAELYKKSNNMSSNSAAKLLINNLTTKVNKAFEKNSQLKESFKENYNKLIEWKEFFQSQDERTNSTNTNPSSSSAINLSGIHNDSSSSYLNMFK